MATKFADGTTGSSVDNTNCSWMTSDNPSSTMESADYTLALASVQSDLSSTGTLVFKSTTNQKATTVKVALLDATMSLNSFHDLGNTGNSYHATGGTDGGPKVTLEGSTSNAFSIEVNAPEGLKGQAPEITEGADWLDVSFRPTANGKGFVLTGKIKSDVSDFTQAKSAKIKLTNPIDDTPILIEVATNVVVAP